MILCVTLNPCLDKTLTVPEWRLGDNVRGLSVREVVGGKGNNVARALKRLGHPSRPVTLLGGPVGDICAKLLATDDGFDTLVVETEAPTRIILTVRTQSSAEQTAFFDPDPTIKDDEAEALVSQVQRAIAEPGIKALTLSGSSPSAATHGVYSELISIARARRIPVFLDTYGPSIEAIWAFWPTVIQLNRREAAGLLKRPSITDQDVLGLLEQWSRRGVACGIVTDGPYPVYIQCRGKRYRATPPTIEAVNPIGSGDSLLAGLVDGWLSGLEAEPMLRGALGCAVANAAVWDAGGIDPEQVRRFGEQVIVEPISGID